MRRRLLRRFAVPVGLAVVGLLSLGSMAFAGSHSFTFSVNGGGGTACSTLAPNATIAPYIEVQFTSQEESGGGNTANFNGANANCSPFDPTAWMGLTVGDPNTAIDVHDTDGKTVLLDAGTSPFQGGITVHGTWTY